MFLFDQPLWYRVAVFPIQTLDNFTGTPIVVLANIVIVAAVLIVGGVCNWSQTWDNIADTGLTIIQAVVWLASVYADQKQFRLSGLQLDASKAVLDNTIARLGRENLSVPDDVMIEIIECNPKPRGLEKELLRIFREQGTNAALLHLLDTTAAAPVSYWDHVQYDYEKKGVFAAFHTAMLEGLNACTVVAGSAFVTTTAVVALLVLVACIPAWKSRDEAVFWNNFIPQIMTSLLVDIFRISQKKAMCSQVRDLQLKIALRGLLEQEGY